MFKAAKRILGFGLLAMVMSLAIAGPRLAAAQEKSLYDRLGGMDAITAVVHEFVGNVAADDRINQYFAGVDIPNLERLLVEQICQGAGGPCQYSGRSMKETHMGMGLSDADFDALVEDLVAALNTFNVPAQEQQELLALLGPMRSDIVENPTTVGMPTTGNASDLSGWLLVLGSGLLATGVLVRRKLATTR